MAMAVKRCLHFGGHTEIEYPLVCLEFLGESKKMKNSRAVSKKYILNAPCLDFFLE